MSQKIPHASGQLSLLTLELMFCNRRGHHDAKHSHHNKDPVPLKIDFKEEQPSPGTESAAFKKIMPTTRMADTVVKS